MLQWKKSKVNGFFVCDFWKALIMIHTFTYPWITYGNWWLWAGSVCACGRMRCLNPSEEPATNDELSWLGDGVVESEWSEFYNKQTKT